MSPACQKKVRPSTTISTSQVFLSHLRNRGNDELSKRSNGSVHQGTKIGSAEEQPRYLKSPESEPASPCTLPKQSYTVSLKEVVYPPADLKHSPAHHTDIPNKHPRQSWSKTVPRRYTRHSVESLLQYISKSSPRESSIVQSFPRKVQSISPAGSSSPVDSGSFPSAEHERVSRLYSKVISLPGYNWVILSQQPRKDRPRRSLLIPGEVY